MAPSSEMYHLWLDVILKEAMNGRASARDGIEVVKFMQKVGQVRSETERLAAAAAAATLCAAKHGKDRIGTTPLLLFSLLLMLAQDLGLEVLEMMKAEEISLSSISLSTFIQMAKAEGSERAVSEAWKVRCLFPPPRLPSSLTSAHVSSYSSSCPLLLTSGTSKSTPL
eukprot:760141-Hanusia_phi.AAC.1